MSFLEQLKKTAEKVTGVGRPTAADLPKLVNDRRPLHYAFEDDGETPNNPAFPLLHYRSAFALDDRFDPAATCEEIFAANGWTGSWRNGIFPFNHFHTNTHEVLGIARGNARVQFGGVKGRTLTLEAGDVVVVPAGTGHCRMAASDDLLVVGAYPGGKDYDQHKPQDVDHAKAKARVAKVGVPKADPLLGENGPLIELWKKP